MAIPGLKFSVTGAPGGMTRGSTGSIIKEPACVADEADDDDDDEEAEEEEEEERRCGVGEAQL